MAHHPARRDAPYVKGETALLFVDIQEIFCRPGLDPTHSDMTADPAESEVMTTCVGATEFTFASGQPVAKGAEKGFFKFGGSSTITLFEKGRIQLAPDLLENTKQLRELYTRVGDAMGRTMS